MAVDLTTAAANRPGTVAMVNPSGSTVGTSSHAMGTDTCAPGRALTDQAPNTVLHPWLQTELADVLASLPPVTTPETDRPAAAQWATWLGHEPQERLPPLRVILVWDNLNHHVSAVMRAFVDDHDWLTVVQLPAYAPELKPYRRRVVTPQTRAGQPRRLHHRPTLYEAAQDGRAPVWLYRSLEKGRIDIMPLLCCVLPSTRRRRRPFDPVPWANQNEQPPVR